MACHLQWYLNENAENTAHALAPIRGGLREAGSNRSPAVWTECPMIAGLTWRRACSEVGLVGQGSPATAGAVNSPLLRAAESCPVARV